METMNPDNKTLTDLVDRAVEIQPGKKSNIILDATMLTSIMTCPRLTDFRFNMNLQGIGGKSNSLECGSIVHKFLEIYYRVKSQGIKHSEAVGYGMAAAELYISGCIHCTDFDTKCTCDNGKVSHTGVGDNMDVYEVDCTECNKGVKKPSCGHIPNDYPGVTNTPAENEGYLIGWKWVLETCQQYVDYYYADFWVPIESEVVKGEILYEDDEVRIMWKAKLDLLMDTNDGIFPVDHKTMKQNRDTVSLNNQFMGQCILSKTRRMYINKVGFQKTLKPAEKFIRVQMNYSASRLMEWQSEILPYYSKSLLMYAETGYFPPNFSNCESKYGNCNFKSVCESEPILREDEIKRLFVVGPVWNPTNPTED